MSRSGGRYGHQIHLPGQASVVLHQTGCDQSERDETLAAGEALN